MSRKAKSKGKLAATKLKSRRTAKGKTRPKKAVSARRAGVKSKSRSKTAIAKAKKRSVMPSGKKIVRIMGHGQFTVDNRTLKKLNDIDNAIVELVSAARSDDTEFKKRLTELSNMVVQNGKPLDPHEIIKSDIILPSADLSIDEAKKLFQGEGVIPEI
jgi:transcriptional regulator with XRE-family HTH domain